MDNRELEERFLKLENREKPEHFRWFKGKYQEIDTRNQPECYDLVLVHAHVDLEELVTHFTHWRYLYTNPCCKPQEQTFSVQFQTENNISVLKAGYDKSSLSPKNMVFIYKNKLNEMEEATHV